MHDPGPQRTGRGDGAVDGTHPPAPGTGGTQSGTGTARGPSSGTAGSTGSTGSAGSAGTSASGGTTDPGSSFSTRGGTVVARCTAGGVEVLGITPRDGWRVDQDLEEGRLEVHFKATGDEVKLDVACVNGVATATVEDS